MIKNDRKNDRNNADAAPVEKVKVVLKSTNNTFFCDYKNAEDLRRLLTPNGRIQGRKRTGLSAREQRLATQAIKRARFMAILPYTNGTV